MKRVNVIRITYSLLVGCLGGLQGQATISAYKAPPKQVAKALHWVSQPSGNGYFVSLPIRYVQQKNEDGSSPVVITADETHYTHHGVLSAKGHVVISQPNKQANAQQAYVYRQHQTKKYSHITLLKQVKLHEPGRLVLADQADFNIMKKNWSLQHAVYRLTLSKQRPVMAEKTTEARKARKARKAKKITQLVAWGKAKRIEHGKPSITDLYHASYSTCSPACAVWYLRGSHVHLDKTAGRGYITHALLYVKNIPIFYFPYFNFPLDDRRKSGLLSPTFSFSTQNGLITAFPIYWNMAANYDDTIVPTYYTQRGLSLTHKFRYLFAQPLSSRGQLQIDLLPNDLEFKQFKQLVNDQYSPSTQRNALAASSNRRVAIHFSHNTSFSAHWSATADYRYVSDDYYNEDFGATALDVSDNQLLQQLAANYASDNWNFAAMLRRYQTLHPIDNQNTLDNQYQELPDLQFYGAWAHRPYGLLMGFSSQFDNFSIDPNPIFGSYQTKQRVEGQRLNLQPSISRPIRYPAFSIVPTLQLAVTGYNLHHNYSDLSDVPARILPTFAIDARAYLQRKVHLIGKDYTQTLEPRLFYLYVPYVNQNALPLFDTVDSTGPLSFSYYQLFRNNRFTNSDRIGDANQISWGVTSRLLDYASQQQHFSASLGQMIYFRDRKVMACQTNSTVPCGSSLLSDNQRRYSPLAGLLSYALNPYWRIDWGMAWEPNDNGFDNQTLDFIFNKDANHIINFGYTFIKNGDSLGGLVPNSRDANLEHTYASIIWPVANHWRALGEWDQNWREGNVQSLLIGLEYSSHCWGVRFGLQHTLVKYNENSDPVFNSGGYLQFTLYGLGGIGPSKPDSLLSQYIPNYSDNFSGQVWR